MYIWGKLLLPEVQCSLARIINTISDVEPVSVLGQKFGDERQDCEAQEILQQAYPDQKIIPLNVDGIAAGGGSIRCATQ